MCFALTQGRSRKETNEHPVDRHLSSSKDKQTRANAPHGARSAMNSARRAVHSSLSLCVLSQDPLTANWVGALPLRIYQMNISAFCVNVITL